MRGAGGRVARACATAVAAVATALALVAAVPAAAQQTTTLEFLSPTDPTYTSTTVDVEVRVTTTVPGRVSISSQGESLLLQEVGEECAGGCVLSTTYRPSRGQLPTNGATVVRVVNAAFVPAGSSVASTTTRVDVAWQPPTFEGYEVVDRNQVVPRGFGWPSQIALHRPVDLVFSAPVFRWPSLTAAPMDTLRVERFGPGRTGPSVVTSVPVAADGRARLRLDPAALPPGASVLELRPSHDGNAGVASTVTVLNGPLSWDATVLPVPGGHYYEGLDGAIDVVVAGGYNGWAVPERVLLSVDGGSYRDTVAVFRSETGRPASERWAQVRLPATVMTRGRHTFAVRLVLSDGSTFGPVTRTVDVLGASGTVSTPRPLVVGKAVEATVRAQAPTGLTVHSCVLGLKVDGWGRDAGCTQATASTGRVSVTPSVAGSTAWSLGVQSTGPTALVNSSLTQAVVVHPDIRVRIAAPDAVHGTAQTAVVDVQELRRLGSPTVARVGQVVTVQRRPLGATTWSTVGRYSTDRLGKAAVPFTPTRGYEWRASLAGPYGTLTSPVDRSAVRAKVTWKAHSPKVAKGRTATYDVVVAPAGTVKQVELQVRPQGSTGAFSTVARASASSSGAARLSTVYRTSRTYEVRVRTVAVGEYGVGTSSVRTTVVP